MHQFKRNEQSKKESNKFGLRVGSTLLTQAPGCGGDPRRLRLAWLARLRGRAVCVCVCVGVGSLGHSAPR